MTDILVILFFSIACLIAVVCAAAVVIFDVYDAHARKKD